jgi:hypothetical protein
MPAANARPTHSRPDIVVARGDRHGFFARGHNIGFLRGKSTLAGIAVRRHSLPAP